AGLEHVDDATRGIERPVVQDCLEKGLARFEMPVEASLGHAQFAGDRDDGHGIGAAGGKLYQASLDPVGTLQEFATGGSYWSRAGACGVRHTDTRERCPSVYHAPHYRHAVRVALDLFSHSNHTLGYVKEMGHIMTASPRPRFSAASLADQLRIPMFG